MSRNAFEALQRGLDALDVPYRLRSGGILEAEIPTALRPRFGQRRTLTAVFDQEVWKHNRSSELVVAGSPLLQELEEILREHAAYQVRVGGELAPRPEHLETWQNEVTVLNGQLERHEPHIRTDLVVRFLYEVHVRYPKDQVELLPVAWSPEEGVLSPVQLAELESLTWYAPEELRALSLSLEPADPEVLETARDACEAELGRRLAPLLREEAEQRRQEAQRREQQYRREARARLEELASEGGTRTSEVQDELRARLDQLKRQSQVEPDVRERAIHLLQHGQCEITLHYREFEVDDRHPVPLPLQHGRPRRDLCGTCPEPRGRYYLDVDSSTGLTCDECGAICRSDSCSRVFSKHAPPHCPHCDAPTYCEDHHSPCTECGRPTCPAHTTLSDCCERALCPDHVVVDRHGNRLCPEHRRRCSVDGLPTHVDEIVPCAVTGRDLYTKNAIHPPEDGRPLHPDEVVVCSATGRPVAKDRAGRCAVDGRWFAVEHLASVVGGETVCAEHAISVDRPAGAVVRSDQVQHCAETGLILAPTEAATCSVRGAVYVRDLVVVCPLTGQTLHRDEAVQPDLDERLLHPEACVTSVASGQLVATDRAILEEDTPGAWLHQGEAAQCDLSGLMVRRARLRAVDCCGRSVADRFTGRSPISGRWWCDEHAAMCDAHGQAVMPDESVNCPVSGRRLCVQHTVTVRCGRRVDVEQAMSLEDGTWGCSDHYVTCPADGGHPAPAEEATGCAKCGAPVCDTHVSFDPYMPGYRACTSHFRECVECSLVTVHEEGQDRCIHCRAVRAPTREEREQYQATLRARVPFVLRMAHRLSVSGSSEVLMFRVQGPLSQVQFLVGGDEILSRTNPGDPWSVVP